MNNDATAADDESRHYAEAERLAAQCLNEHEARHLAGQKALKARYGDKK